jgi:ribonuclease P protein component
MKTYMIYTLPNNVNSLLLVNTANKMYKFHNFLNITLINAKKNKNLSIAIIVSRLFKSAMKRNIKKNVFEK